MSKQNTVSIVNCILIGRYEGFITHSLVLMRYASYNILVYCKVETLRLFCLKTFLK